MQTVKIFQSGSRTEMSIIKVIKSEEVNYYLVEHPINLSPDMRHYEFTIKNPRNTVFNLTEQEYNILEGGYEAMKKYVENSYEYSWFNAPSAMLVYCAVKGLDFNRFL